MPRNRKAILERKKHERREMFIKAMQSQGIEKKSIFGHSDLTPHEASKAMIYKEIRAKERLHIMSTDI